MTARTSKSHPDWKQGFLVVGNHLVLDFLHSRPVQDGESWELRRGCRALLRWFEAAGLLPAHEAANIQNRWGESDRALQTLKAVWELREKLRKAVLSWELGVAVHRSTVEELNRVMVDHPMRTRLKATRNALSEELRFDTQQPDDLLAPLAHGAATLFTEASRDRVRKLGQRVLHFRDSS